MSDNLTLKQQRFADEYIISANAVEAALKAGYSKKSVHSMGDKLLSNPKVRRYIDERLSELQSAKVADQQEVLEFLTSVMRGEITEQVLMLVGDGVQEIVDVELAGKDRLKAAELIGKRHQMFTDKVNLEAVSGVTIINDLP